jgi:glycolate oxidase FAD binding subunit
MLLCPTSLEELTRQLAEANAHRSSIEAVDLRALHRVLEHHPEDLTVTVEAGMTLSELQAALARAGQWLPIDPPHPDRITIEQLLSHDLTGPRRFGFGTIREHLIGIRVALADGRVIRSGGKVVKNVAGYDLLKLFVGSEGTLGVPVEATFKLRPLPEAEELVQLPCVSLTEADARIQELLESNLTPVLLDLHNVGSGGRPNEGAGEQCVLVAGFSGVRKEVEWQLTEVARLGWTEPGSLAYQTLFFERENEAIKKHSVLPSRCVEIMRLLGAATFVARAGNGLIYSRGGKSIPSTKLPHDLFRRIKEAYDPNHVFPELKL